MLPVDIVRKIQNMFADDFIGDSSSLTEEEKSLVYDEASNIFRRISDNWGDSIRGNERQIIVAALVELTKEWDSDEDAWLEYIAKKLLGSQRSIEGKLYAQLCKCIDSLGREKRMFVFDCFKKKYYASICCHAFSPKKSIFSFFDMCWEIYCKDLAQQYDGNENDLSLIASSLHRRISNSGANDDDIQLGSKVYGLKAGIKGLAIERIDLLKKVLDSALGTIDCLMNSEPIKIDTYFKTLGKEWWEIKLNELGHGGRRNRAKRENVAYDYSQIKAKYILDEGKAKLSISPFRLMDNLDCEPYIEIKMNGKSVKTFPIPTMGSGIIMTTKCLELDLNDLGVRDVIDTSVEITHGAKTIFESKSSLRREFILFAGNKETNSQSLVPGTYFLYAPSIKQMVVPADIQRGEGKNIYSIVTNDGDVVRSTNRIVFFETEKTDKNMYFTANERGDAYYQQDGIIYKIIDGDAYLNVSKDFDTSDLGIRAGSFIGRLSDIKPTENEGELRYCVSKEIGFGKPINLSVFKFSNNHIVLSLSVLKFEKISIIYDKEIYYGGDSTGNVSFKTERYSLEKKINIEDDENAIPFEEGEIVLLPPILRWRFNDEEWHTKPSGTIYYKDLPNSSTLDVETPLSVDYFAALMCGCVKALERTSDGKHYKLGQKIYSLDTHSLEEEATLFVRVGNAFYELARIVLKSKFLNEPINVDGKNFKIFWNPDSYVGESSSGVFRLRIKDLEGLNVREEPLTSEARAVLLVDSLEEGQYDVQIVGISGGFLKKEEILFEKRYLFGNAKNLRYKNKTIRVYKAVVFNQDGTEVTEIRPFYLTDIKFLSDKDGFDVYSCRMFLINRITGRRIYLDYMYDQNGQQVLVNPIKLEIKTLVSCYLGYGLNVNDPDLEYDGEFSLTYDGKTSVFNHGVRFVDYYGFEIVD